MVSSLQALNKAKARQPLESGAVKIKMSICFHKASMAQSQEKEGPLKDAGPVEWH